jgi:hypothetical protein
MTKLKSKGAIRAEAWYNSLEKIDGFIEEAARILRNPKPSAEEMKKVEHLKNLAKADIGKGNLHREILVSWDKIVAGFNSMEGVAVKKIKRTA